MAAWDMKFPPGINDQDLARFFEKDLTDQQRDHLLSLPNEDMQRELRQLYNMSKRGFDAHGRADRAKKKSAADPLKPKRTRVKDMEVLPPNP